MRVVRSAQSRAKSAAKRQNSAKGSRPGTAKSGGRPGTTPRTPSRPRTAEWRNGQLVDEYGNPYFPVSAPKRFKRSLRKIWSTQYTENIPADDREKTLKTTLRELFIYLVFVIILCIVGFCMLDPTMYYFTKVMKGLFVDGPEFEQISKHEDFFAYASGGLLDGLYWEQYYDGADVKNKEHHFIYFENKLIGVPRIRQVRIKNNTCTLSPMFKDFIPGCIGSFEQDLEETKSFGLKNGTAWFFKSAEDGNGSDVKGRFSVYGGGGYSQLLGPDKFQSQKKLDSLKENLWLDRQTRAIFIEFSVYNANVNMFCIVTLILEYTPTGAAVPYYHFNTLKLLRYVKKIDYFVMACEGILILYLIYYLIEEIIEFKVHRWEYFKIFWNYVDIAVICLVFGLIIFNLYRTFEVSTKLKLILDGYDSLYANFGGLAGWQQTYNDIVAVTLFIAWLKVFKYISFNQTLMELQNTLSTCALDMAAFSVMFFIMFLAYAQWGYLLFGYMVADFKTYFDAVFALFRIILGDFDFLAIQEASRSIGPVFFISYIFSIFFIVLNMFLAILFDTYAEVKEEMTELCEGAFGVGDLFQQGIDDLMAKLNKKKEHINNVQDAVKESDTDGDKKIEYREFSEELMKRGYKEEEIHDLFYKYDRNCDGVLDKEDQEAMVKDLKEQEDDILQELLDAKLAKAETKTNKGSSTSLNLGDSEDEEEDEEAEKEVKPEQIEELAMRIETCEDDVGDLIERIDIAIAQLEAMDKAVLPGREQMGKLLDSIYKRSSSMVDFKVDTSRFISRPQTAVSQQSDSDDNDDTDDDNEDDD